MHSFYVIFFINTGFLLFLCIDQNGNSTLLSRLIDSLGRVSVQFSWIYCS